MTPLSVSRYLNKMLLRKLSSSQLPENISYLSKDFVIRPNCNVQTASQYMDPHVQLEVYQQRARRSDGVIWMCDM